MSRVSETSIIEAQDFGTPTRLPPGLHIGTSGWHYDSWRGPFYPEEVRIRDQLAYYASRFCTTEINASFYRLPTEKAVRAWRATVPGGFVFAWKASRFLTHFKRLKDCEDSVTLIFGRMEALGEAFGPVLFQLPPQFHANHQRLADFLRLLPKKRRCAFEFRHESWYERPILDLLGEHEAALCISDHAAAPSPFEVTADFVYLRGHGPTGRYHGTYSDETLKDWAKRARRWRRQGRDVFVYFDNDQKSAAPQDAERLGALLSR